jgi:hypothetical protein
MVFRFTSKREENFEKLLKYAEIPTTSRKESKSLNAYGFDQFFPIYLILLFVVLLVKGE